MTDTSASSTPISKQLEQGIAFHNAGKLGEAEKLYRNVLKVDPGNADANNLLGLIAHSVGKSELACQFYRKAVEANPGFSEAHFNLANACRRLGKYEDAIQSYNQVLQLNPDHADARNNLGVTCLGLGHLEEATQCFRTLLASQPDSVQALNNLGNAERISGNLGAARESLMRAIQLNPKFYQAHHNLALTELAAGDIPAAVDSCQKALALQPGDPAMLHTLADCHQSLGHLQEAEACLRKSIASGASNPGVFNSLGLLLRQTDRSKEAVDIFKHAVNLDPVNTTYLNNLGIVCKESNDLDQAEAVFLKALEIDPQQIDAKSNLGCVQFDLRKTTQALITLEEAQRMSPLSASILLNLGVVQEAAGDIEQAEESFRAALALDNNLSAAHRQLSSLVRHQGLDDDIRAMEGLISVKELDDKAIADLGFGLGKAYKDIGDYERSFEFYQLANHKIRSSFEYDIEAEKRYYEQIKKHFNENLSDLPINRNSYDLTPVFVVGMPRSGTSLVEQILASHPDVFGAGELFALKNLSFRLHNPELKNDVDYFVHLKDFDPTEMGREYIKGVRGLSNDEAFVVDKFPHNFLHLGLIRLILPDAKIIHISRNPMDNCLSIFTNYFRGFHPYAYDLQELGEHYRRYQEMMDHWRSVLPAESWHEIRYEELVSDQESQTRGLLDYCGLSWRDECMDFHKTKRRVGTASNAQVRRPMYKDSLELWRRYEKQLQPLHDAIFGEAI